MKRFAPKHTVVGLVLGLMVLGLCGCGSEAPPVVPSQDDALVFVKIVSVTNKEQPKSFMTEGHVAPGFTFESSMEYQPGTVHLIAVEKADYGDGLVFEEGDIVIIGDDGKPFLAPAGTALQVPITMTELSRQCWNGELIVPDSAKYTNLIDDSDFGYDIDLLHAIKGQWREIDDEGKPIPGDRDRLFIAFHPIDLEKCLMSWIGGARPAGYTEYRVVATNTDRNQILVKFKDSDPPVQHLITVIEPQKQIEIKWDDKKRIYEFLPVEEKPEDDTEPVVNPTPVVSPTPTVEPAPVAPVAPVGTGTDIAPNDVNTPVEVPEEPEPQPETNLDPFG